MGLLSFDFTEDTVETARSLVGESTGFCVGDSAGLQVGEFAGSCVGNSAGL